MPLVKPAISRLMCRFRILTKYGEDSAHQGHFGEPELL